MKENMLVRELIVKIVGKHNFQKISNELYSIIHNKFHAILQKYYANKFNLRDYESSRIISTSLNKRSTQKIKQDIQAHVAAIDPDVLAAHAGISFAQFYKDPPATCLLLSGGAFKGSFEVGNIVYFKNIWDLLNIGCVCGTSVGAINSLKLAEKGVDGIPEIIDFWFDLRTQFDIFVRSNYVQSLNQRLVPYGDVDIAWILEKNGLERILRGLGLSDNLIERFLVPGAVTAAGTAGIGVGVAAGGPIGIIIALASVVNVIAGSIELYDQSQHIINAIDTLKSALNDLMDNAKGINEYWPLATKIESSLDINRIGDVNNPKLRIAMVDIENGENYYFTEEFQVLKKSANRDKAEQSVDLSNNKMDAIVKCTLGSSSPPMLFVPVTIDLNWQEHKMIDGGLREVLPVEAARDLGYKRIIGVISENNDVSLTNLANLGLMDIPLRGIEIMLKEIIENEIAMSEGIDESILNWPDIDIYTDAFGVNPGLIQINICYGYMKAFLNTSDLAQKNLDSNTKIVLLILLLGIVEKRTQILNMESECYFYHPAGKLLFDRDKIHAIRQKKRQLLDLVLAYYESTNEDPDSLPIRLMGENGERNNINSWWQDWEAHNNPVFIQYSLWEPLPINFDVAINNLIFESLTEIGEVPETDKFLPPIEPSNRRSEKVGSQKQKTGKKEEELDLAEADV